MKQLSRTAIALLFLASATPALIAGLSRLTYAHEGEFSAGEPGNPKKSARIVQVTMREGDGKMLFVPDRLEVRKGEQIRFILRNNGVLKHEFVLATIKDNDKHAALMRKYPNMEHADPNARSVEPGKAAEMIWRFDKAGKFEFACLIPGHRESGMHGTVIVK